MSCHYRVPEVPPGVQTGSMYPAHISALQSYQKALHSSGHLNQNAFCGAFPVNMDRQPNHPNTEVHKCQTIFIFLVHFNLCFLENKFYFLRTIHIFKDKLEFFRTS